MYLCQDPAPGDPYPKSLWWHFLGNVLLPSPKGTQVTPPITEPLGFMWLYFSYNALSPLLVLQPCMFRKSFKIGKKRLTGNCLQANIKESRGINYIQIRLMIGIPSQIPHGLAHVYTLDHSFLAFSVPFPSFSTLIQTRVCLLGHEGTRGSGLGLFLTPWVFVPTTALTPGFLGFSPYKLCGPWWQLGSAEPWELPAVFQTLVGSAPSQLDNPPPESLPKGF